MKTLGLIGGLSWFSTAVYYRTINQLVNERLGGSHSARMLLYSMEHTFFRERLSQFGIESLIPESGDREFIHASIFNELTKFRLYRNLPADLPVRLRRDGV